MGWFEIEREESSNQTTNNKNSGSRNGGGSNPSTSGDYDSSSYDPDYALKRDSQAMADCVNGKFQESGSNNRVTSEDIVNAIKNGTWNLGSNEIPEGYKDVGNAILFSIIQRCISLKKAS